MLEEALRVVPNFPKPGIDFLDISPLLENPIYFKALVDQLAVACGNWKFDKIAGIESRGFILGGALAQKMGKGFVMVRKKGKLPGTTISHSYDLEYGSDTIEILATSIKAGEQVLVLDDVLATGGTAGATHKLIAKVGGQVVGALFLIELTFLSGGEKLPMPYKAIIKR